MQDLFSQWQRQSLIVKLIPLVAILGVFVFSLCICGTLFVIVTRGNEQQTASNPNASSRPTSVVPTPVEFATPVENNTPSPTDTPVVEDTPVPQPQLEFADFIQNPSVNNWTGTQYSNYTKSLDGQTLSSSGVIVDIDESFGREYLSLDIQTGEPQIDAYLYITEDDLLEVGVGQQISFTGVVDGTWKEKSNYYSLQIKDVKLLELGEIPTPTPSPTPGPTSTPTPNIGDDIMAGIMCEDFVKDRLKSPSTADFGGMFSDLEQNAVFFEAETAAELGVDTSTLHNSGVWVVNGEVDAQNAFGAEIRSEYTCVMDFNKDSDQWILLDIGIE